MTSALAGAGLPALMELVHRDAAAFLPPHFVLVLELLEMFHDLGMHEIIRSVISVWNTFFVLPAALTVRMVFAFN